MRYQVWDKKSNVITPIGEILSPAQWIERYPMAETMKTVVAGGEINGAYFGVFSVMKEMYLHDGCDFSDCETDQEVLDAIEAFEDIRNMPSDEPSNEDIIASSLAYMAMMQSETE